ncbi:hypothetical protein B9Z55_000582 [Caenorhabditis nigoni]|uniref:Uncharacterized protein n=1 Tax=Caenorhabditis nigoni TaxID=1611254 RepID=A0A2G5VTW4_9PELO|nr:hypothetical protein B9Z55_000582 [Caenorhabditis nigoni]
MIVVVQKPTTSGVLVKRVYWSEASADWNRLLFCETTGSTHFCQFPNAAMQISLCTGTRLSRHQEQHIRLQAYILCGNRSNLS